MLIERINALIWTCALELPVYAWWMRTHVTDRTIVIAVPIGLQCVTQPWLWEYTARTGSAPLPLLGAEAAAWLVEAMLLFVAARRFGAPPMSPSAVLAASGSANLLSLAAGVLLNRLLYG